MRHRQSHRNLTNSRIYPKGNRLYLFSADPIENPKTGKIAKWHSLCNIKDGEETARALAQEILLHNRSKSRGRGDLPDHIEAYRLYLLKKREKDRPKEPARERLFENANKEISRTLQKISDAFEDFDVDQVMPKDVATFVDQWELQRMAQVYWSKMSGFFAWCCRKGIRDNNPCREVNVEKPPKNTHYITHKDFHAARDALLLDDDDKPIPGGEMAQCYVDLCYLIYQRTTDVRLLKEMQIGNSKIHFKPTKTERASGATVDIQITPQIQAVLDRARKLGKVKSIYVIHKDDGSPYTASGLRSALSRACARAGVLGVTSKGIRAKAATDAFKAGYRRDQIKVGLAHTSEGTTDGYIKQRETPVSEVVMTLPPKE